MTKEVNKNSNDRKNTSNEKEKEVNNTLSSIESTADTKLTTGQQIGPLSTILSNGKEKISMQNFSPFKDNLIAREESYDIPKKTLVAIPCYNEEKTIGSIVLKAKRYADSVVVIDDGSTDKTAQVAEYAGATVMQHGGNRGYGTAIQSCFNYAREIDADVMTILDGDGQHDADQLYGVMKPVIENNVDISIGSRFLDENSNNVPSYRRFGIWVLTRFTNAGSKEAYHKVTDGQSGFRAYSKEAIQKILPKDTQMGVSAEILMQARKQNLMFAEVPISVSYEGDTSTEGAVGHGFGVLVSIFKYMEVEHSLLFFGLPGFILFLLGMFFGVQTYIAYEANGYLTISLTLMTITLLVLGTLSGMTGLILHAVINAGRRV